MNHYTRSIRFWIMYFVLLMLLSPVIIFDISINEFSVMHIFVTVLVICIIPLNIAALFHEIFILDAIQEDKIISKTGNFPKINSFMLVLFSILFVVSILMTIEGQEYLSIALGSMCLLFPFINSRLIVTEERIYTRFFDVDRAEVVSVVNIGRGRILIKCLDNKEKKIAVNLDEEVLKVLQDVKK